MSRPGGGDDGSSFLGYVGTLALTAGRTGTWDWDLAADRLVRDEQERRLFGLEPALWMRCAPGPST